MNEVIVVGGNHHNALGVIRSFGKNGIKINLIVTNDTKYPFIVKSKYVKKYSIIKENEVEILDELSKYKNITPKPAIIPTSDYAEYVIDKNLDKLKKTFIVPSINNTQGEVIKYMDKFNQIDLCKKYKIDMAKSCVLVLNNELNLNIKLKYPYILKPIESINGKKTDIQIVSNPKEFSKCIEILKEKKYKKILVQEYLKYDYELTLMGCSSNGKVIVPGAVKKIRRYPEKSGNVSYGEVIPLTKNDFYKIKELLKSINYNGLFDIEVFKVGNQYILNEINFRNSGNTYVLTYKNIFLPVIWYYLAIGKSVNNLKFEFTNSFYMRDSNLERTKLFNKEISFKEYIHAKRNSQISFINDLDDNKVKLWKLLYAVLRRIDKNGKL